MRLNNHMQNCNSKPWFKWNVVNSEVTGKGKKVLIPLVQTSGENKLRPEKGTPNVHKPIIVLTTTKTCKKTMQKCC